MPGQRTDPDLLPDTPDVADLAVEVVDVDEVLRGWPVAA